jgi:SAM-dependent methyltransferase
LPLATGTCARAFAVDALHHLTDDPTFFAEVARILERDGTFLAVTDSEENMRRRSLTRFFPEILEVELRRYPALEELHVHAARARRCASSPTRRTAGDRVRAARGGSRATRS